MWVYQLWIGGFVSGLLMGLIGWRAPRVTVAISALLLGLFGLYALVLGVWAGRCWDCNVGGEDTRGIVFLLSMMAYGGLLTVTLATMWLSMGVGWLVRRR